MTAADFTSLLPLLVIAAGIVVLMMQIAFFRQGALSWLLCCGTLLLTALSIAPASQVPAQVTPLIAADSYSLFFTAVVVLAALFTALLSREYLEHRKGENEEFYLLLLLATSGAVVLVQATHLASLLLGLELLGVALYALIAYPERSEQSLEAAIKYLVLSGAASAILLFGFALMYAVLGTLSFTEIGQRLAEVSLHEHAVLITVATAMVFAGIAFKLSLVPFHMWTPDVYHGAPAPITGFLATVSKGAVFVAVMRLFLSAELYSYQGVITGLVVLAIASMLVGNLLALLQDNLKRLLAYSSIAHLGYLLIALILFSSLSRALAVEAASYYLVAYTVMTLAAFALVSIISNRGETEQDLIEDLKGLLWQRPFLATLLITALLSLAGIPLTAGFIAKFYIVTIGAAENTWLLLSALILGSGLGIYYYLRTIYVMTQKREAADGTVVAKPSITASLVVVTLLILVLWLGIYPQQIMEYLHAVASTLA